jgi:AAA domain (dynein-related subfamily)
LPRPSQAAVEEAIRSLTALDYAPNVTSMFEALLVAWRLEATTSPRTIAVVNDTVDELFGVLPDEPEGRLSPFRRQGERPLWQVRADSGRKTVWSAATRHGASTLFDERSDGRRDFREGLRNDALDVLLEQLPTRVVRQANGERTQVRARPSWQAMSALLLRSHEFEDPPEWDDLREQLKEFLGIDDAAITKLFEDDALVADPGGSPEWDPSTLAADLRPGMAVAPATVTVQPPSASGAAPEIVVIEERTRRMLRLALRSYSAVLLVGPPGTGKGLLLREMVREIRESPAAFGFARTEIPEPILSTPDESWTAFELLGGLAPKPDGALEYAPGLVLDAIREDRWLILDETNRGDMDKIFGPLLTWLADEEVQVGKTKPGDEGLAVRLGWVDAPSSSVTPAAGIAGATELASGESVRYLAGREWRLLGTYNPQDAQRVFRFGQALSRRFVTVPIPAVSEANFAVLLDSVAPDLPEQARFCIRGLYGAHMQSERTALGPAVFMRMPRYVRNGLPSEASVPKVSESEEAPTASEAEGPSADEEMLAEGDEAASTVVSDELLSQLLSEAYVLSVGKYLSGFSDAEFEQLGQRVTVERKLLPEAEWTWVGQRRLEIA